MIKKLSIDQSIVLDSMRLVASLAVLVSHASSMWSLNVLPTKKDYGHLSVIIFFVLSGYVISYTTKINKRDLSHYIQARISRLYSIALPSLIITLIVQFFVKYSNVNLYNQYSQKNTIFKYLSSLFFSNEVWFFSSAPSFNGPYWSLGYEFWYYVIYGLFIFRYNRASALMVVLACFFIGPKVLIMMPIWLFGVVACYFKDKLKINTKLAILYIIISFAVFSFLFSHLNGFPFNIGYKPWFYSGQFITDYILGIIMSIIILLIPNSNVFNIKANSKGFKNFRMIADLTFPIYLFHFPFLILFKSIHFRVNDFHQFIIAVFSVICLCSLIGYFFNQTRPMYNYLYDYLYKKYYYIKNRSLENNSNIL